MTDRNRTLARVVLVAAVVVAGCAAAPPGPRVSAETARAELVELIADVTAATAYRYRTSDDRGRWMDTAKVIWIPEAHAFAAVYHTWTDADARFHVQLATSDDLMHWTWVVELADRASQPTIAESSDGGYVVAWEQEPDPIHVSIAAYATWDALREGAITRRFDVPVTMPACGEGTPSIEFASSQRVDLGFHYHGDCVRDRQAGGSTDWKTWQASARPEIDAALEERGATGHLGDRESISFRGRVLTLVEGQLTLDDFGSWRTFLYDSETESAELISFRTHAGSVAMGNPTISQLEVDGQPAIFVTLYLFTEGARGEEDGPLFFYRVLPTAPPPNR